MTKYIALTPQQVATLKPRGFHQKVEDRWKGYLLVEDVSFYLFCTLHLRGGQAEVLSPLPDLYKGRYKCLPITLKL